VELSETLSLFKTIVLGRYLGIAYRIVTHMCIFAAYLLF